VEVESDRADSSGWRWIKLVDVVGVRNRTGIGWRVGGKTGKTGRNKEKGKMRVWYCRQL
jgi:hypothetical protein